jgi:hypothetical protein
MINIYICIYVCMRVFVFTITRHFERNYVLNASQGMCLYFPGGILLHFQYVLVFYMYICDGADMA